MFHPRPCGCKGLRTCLVCEQDCNALVTVTPVSAIDKALAYTVTPVSAIDKALAYVYCPHCDLAWPGWDRDSWTNHPHHQGQPVRFPGVKICLDFISLEEETELVKLVDEVPWDPSQSGRRKQNYGPKCNFKKRKVKLDNFDGYPLFTKFVQDRFSTLDLLCNFQTVEQCSLEYTIEKGASIDPHIDDCWIWGERIPTVNLLSDSVLTLTKFSGTVSKYNLIDTLTYPRVVKSNGHLKDGREIKEEFATLAQRNTCLKVLDTRLQDKNGSDKHACTFEDNLEHFGKDSKCLPKIVRLPMPRRSLIVFYGMPRYDYEHGILREDVTERRICITYRELTPTYHKYGNQAEIGNKILEAGKNFWDHRQRYNISTSC